jgi:hypothetical protein
MVAVHHHNPAENKHWRRGDPPPLVPKMARSPSVMSLDEWYSRHEYFVECIWKCVCTHVERGACRSSMSNPDEVYDRLVRYLYRTSLNRFYSFNLIK